MSFDWTELYRPKTLADVVGNPKAVEELKAWADSWETGNPKKNAAVLIGTPGTGKTSAAMALANDYRWDVVEMNASDQRNADSIKSIALRGALGDTFAQDGTFRSSKEGYRKLIILDEADNIGGQEDRGGVPAIVELVRTTKQPIILIVNDYYALTKKSSVLKTQTEQIKFSKIKTVTVRGVLRKITKDQGVKISDRALELLAENSNGDLRSAVRDLQAIALGKQEISEQSTVVVGSRDVEKTMYAALDDVFKGGDPQRARRVMSEVDETPDAKMLWIEENLPYAYREHLDLYNGCRMLSRADVFLGRVTNRQHYGFWSYASDLMSFGVCAARAKEAHGYVRYNFPMYLMKMSRSKGPRAMQMGVSLKLGVMVHMSGNGVRQDLLPYFRQVYQRDKAFQLRMTIDLELEDEEVAYLLGEKLDSPTVKQLMADVKRVMENKDRRIEGSDKRPTEESPKAEPPVPAAPAASQRSLFQY